MSKHQTLQAVIFGLLVGAFCSGCGPNHSGGNVGNNGGDAGSASAPPKTGGSDSGIGGNADETGGASTGGQAGNPATGGSCGHSCTGGSPSGGASPAVGGASGSSGALNLGGEAGQEETGGASGSSGSPNVGGSAGAPEGVGGSEGGASGHPATGGEAGSDPATGGEAGFGGDVGTGGASGSSGSPNVGGSAGAPEGVGGSEDGGVPGVGGVAGNDPGTGGASGNPATGGEAGSDQGGAGGATCAANGSACTVPEDCCSDVCYQSHCVNAEPAPFSCSTPVSDPEFAAFEYDLVDGVCATALDDIYVATGQITVGWQGYLTHFDGSSWSEEDLPETAHPVNRIVAVSCEGANDVWAGGSVTPGSSQAILFHKTSAGWSIEAVPFVAGEDLFVASIYDAGDIIFVAVEGFDTDMWLRDSRIWTNAGGTWSKMTLPPHELPLRILKVRGRSADEVYAVGSKLMTSGDAWGDAVLWHYDGSTWSEVALPADLTVLYDISRNDDGELYVIGNSAVVGVRMVTFDLETWERVDTGTLADTAIETPRLGAAVSGGTMYDAPAGMARFSILSEGTWGSPSPFSTGLNGVWDIQFVPNSDMVLIVVTDGSDSGSVFRMTCQ